jgi:hypothetical protein
MACSPLVRPTGRYRRPAVAVDVRSMQSSGMILTAPCASSPMRSWTPGDLLRVLGGRVSHRHLLTPSNPGSGLPQP